MIKKVKNYKDNVCIRIHNLFQSSYNIEAKLLKVNNFPPLSRTIEDIKNSDNIFYAFLVEKSFVSIAEIKINKKYTHIQSLVVHPNFFRKGLASKMILFIISTFKSNLFIVETGVDNYPARNLYEKYGFVEKKRWLTDHGVIKIQYHLVR